MFARKIGTYKGGCSRRISFRSLSVRYDEKAIEKAMALGRTGGLFQRWYDRWRISLTGHSAAIDASFDEKHLTGGYRPAGCQVCKASCQCEAVWERRIVSFDEGRPSMKIDKAALEEAAALQLKKGESGEVEIPATDIQKPNMTKEAAKEINAVLAEYTTTFYAGGSSKCKSLQTVSAAGTSHRESLFPITRRRAPVPVRMAISKAPVIINGRIEPGTGGGVCQVSTTLFNAVIPVRAADRAYLPASYAPIGRDATVAEGSLDFLLLNHLKHGVYIYAVYEPGAVTVRILGNQEDKPSFVGIA